jgi:RecB family endonuclease NucS
LPLGLRLSDEEGITGGEFPGGGRFINILALDRHGRYVVIELKVSRGYDRVVGGSNKIWRPCSPARGIIVANEITADLKLACSRVPDVRLIEYEISFKLRPV